VAAFHICMKFPALSTEKLRARIVMVLRYDVQYRTNIFHLPWQPWKICLAVLYSSCRKLPL